LQSSRRRNPMSKQATALLVTAFVASLVLVLPLQAVASAKEPVAIATDGTLTGPTSAAGTFTLSGAVSDSGTFVETFRIAGLSIQGVKTLSGSRGTITLVVEAVLRWTSPTTADLSAGHWRFASGTGAYAGLSGGGAPGAAGSADLATGEVAVVHRGFVSSD
jgi:hypothetical protein